MSYNFAATYAEIAKLSREPFDASSKRDKSFFYKWHGSSLGYILMAKEAEKLRQWVLRTVGVGPWLQPLRKLVTLHTEYDKNRREPH